MRRFCFRSLQRRPNIVLADVRDRARLARAARERNLRQVYPAPICSLEVGTITFSSSSLERPTGQLLYTTGPVAWRCSNAKQGAFRTRANVRAARRGGHRSNFAPALPGDGSALQGAINRADGHAGARDGAPSIRIPNRRRLFYTDASIRVRTLHPDARDQSP